MRIETTDTVRCSPQILFSWITEPDKQKQWMKGLISNTPTNSTTGLGSTFRLVIQEGRKTAEYDGDTTAYEAPSLVEIRMWGGNFPKGMIMRVTYRLTEVGEGTRLDYLLNVEGQKFSWLTRLLLILAKIFSRMQLRSFLKKLRTLAEAEAALGTTKQ
jgi:uncharacterized protein YndB with AHSA1/START domain